MGDGSRTRSNIHLRQSLLVVQYVLLRRLFGYSKTDVPGRWTKDTRHLYSTCRASIRTEFPFGNIPSVRFLGTENLHPVEPVDCRCGKDGRAEVLPNPDVDLSSSSRLQPPAGRSE